MTKETDDLKAQLLQKLRSGDLVVVKEGIDGLRLNGWLSDGSLQNYNLTFTRLSGLDLSNGDFQGADFHRADLFTADLTNANLSNAYLTGANLSNADLTNASFSTANLTGVNLSNADLTGANLSNADLTNAVLNQAILNRTTLTTGTVLPDGTHWTDETDMARFTQEDHSDSWRSSDPRSPAFYGFDNVSRVDIHTLLETLEKVVATIGSPFEPRDLEEWLKRERLLTNAIVDRQEDAVPPLLEALQQALQRYHDHWNPKQLENVMTADRTGFASYKHAFALGRVNRTIQLLGIIGDARAVPVLIDLLGSSDPIIQRAASAALSNIDSPLAASVGAQLGIAPLNPFRMRLHMFLATGRADANFMERLDTIAERKATDGRQVALALTIQLSLNSDQVISSIGTIVELSDEEVVYLVEGLREDVNAEHTKEREVKELIDRLLTGDSSSKQSALQTLRDNGWLTDGSLQRAPFDAAIHRSFNSQQEDHPLSLPKADLQDANFQGAYLIYANLEGVNLRGANLQDANLTGANLKKADLVKAILKEARLVRANLSSTDLSQADLSLANCYEADLSNTNLTGAKMKGTKGSKANLQGANLQQACLEFARILETAIVDSDTILPDGTRYDPALGPAQFKRFTDPKHPDFWRPEPGSVWWYLDKQSDK